MAKKQRILLILLTLGLLLGFQAQPLQAVPPQDSYTSNQFTQPDIIDTSWTNYQDIPETYEQIAENETDQLYADQAA